ncbi:hypothetical protein [Nostoc parmelioides]|uniref:RiboL-PSP-HEPN domain-containing protein n=1 Tax=Nostoc parmelioides FACHB-3921 TaxID=2692909 RepID=A0ABR8BNN4_9NOSO|nr:hypothetical protein [Nostoc parmelioides]MBD2255294.1 hypothetical protein [Nostoc parmelioides FACHB-3921]
MTVENLCSDFIALVDGIFGTYLDATVGFQNQALWLEAEQKKMLKELSINDPINANIQYLDERIIGYNDKPPDQGEQIKHLRTQGEFKQQNRFGGNNHILLGNLCLVAIYQHWEDHYREKIAIALGKKKNELISDIFGDIRHLRRSIIHNSGRAINEVKTCRIINWFQPDQTIALNQEQFEFIVRHTTAYVRSLASLESTPQAKA